MYFHAKNEGFGFNTSWTGSKSKKNGSTGGIVSQQEPQGLTTGLTGEKSP